MERYLHQMKRDKSNYPPSRKGYSCHHVAYPYHAYRGPVEHGLYQNNEALLIPTLNTRHNLGALTVHALIDPKYGPPPKPRRTLMLDAIDFMKSLEDESRIRRLGEVIGFFTEEADFNSSYESADQALEIAKHYSMQHQIITEGGESFIRSQQYRRPLGEAA